MSGERIVLRHNDRNISYKEAVNGKYLFTKSSVSSDSHPADEYCFWEKFYNLNTGFIPLCHGADREGKTIRYEWLEGYEQLSGQYSLSYIKKLLEFLDTNARINTAAKISEDSEAISLSRKRLAQQLGYYRKIRDRAAEFYRDFISKSDFETAFERALENFCCEDALCHGDLGKSNILVKDGDVKIIDFEYSMLSSRELDYGRLLSSVFLAYRNREIGKREFSDMVLAIAESPIKRNKLARLAGLQLTMRIIHTYFNKEKLPEDSHSAVRTALNLLCDDSEPRKAEFLTLFVL